MFTTTSKTDPNGKQCHTTTLIARINYLHWTAESNVYNISHNTPWKHMS